MQFIYEPFVMRRFAEGRIFYVSPKMPFEFFVDCFQYEHPFFIVSQLEDGRIAIAPHAMIVPQYLLQAGFGPQDLLPTEFEYVTIKNGNYPLIVTAHPVTQIDLWLKKFEKFVKPYGKQNLSDFITTAEFLPLKTEWKPGQLPQFQEQFQRQPITEPVRT
jgi:hypothetical protein